MLQGETSVSAGLVSRVLIRHELRTCTCVLYNKWCVAQHECVFAAMQSHSTHAAMSPIDGSHTQVPKAECWVHNLFLYDKKPDSPGYSSQKLLHY